MPKIRERLPWLVSPFLPGGFVTAGVLIYHQMKPKARASQGGTNRDKSISPSGSDAATAQGLTENATQETIAKHLLGERAVGMAEVGELVLAA